MRLKIVQAGDPVLRQMARPLTREEIVSPDIQRLIHDMRETMHDAPGVGLAAPQVGLSLQLAVVEDRAEILRDLPPEQLAERERRPVPFHVLINPVIRSQADEAVDFFEGCLSVADFIALVPRAKSVKVEFLDERAEPRVVEAAGWYARILQHEIDHLNGGLYLDRMRSRSFACVENFNRYWKGRPVSDVLAELGVRTKS
jgi:peptide deformylase